MNNVEEESPQLKLSSERGCVHRYVLLFDRGVVTCVVQGLDVSSGAAAAAAVDMFCSSLCCKKERFLGQIA